MARKTLVVDERTLDELIKSYYLNKAELDGYDKICKEENAKIKSKMDKIKQDTYAVDDLTAKITIQRRESFNEAKLLEVVKKHDIDCIRIKEYVDMDALESVIFSGAISKEALLELNSCKEVKEVQTLKITKKKEA